MEIIYQPDDRVKCSGLTAARAYYQRDVRHEDNWPIGSVQPVRLYLSASAAELRREPVQEERSCH